MERDPVIDLLRGLNIGAMVFYTLLAALSDSLPWIFVHNEPRGLYPGDFVLPLFLFASGMSLVFYERKRRSEPLSRYAFDVFMRAAKLLLAWVPLSLFSAGRFFGMDELALNVALFAPCAILVKLPLSALLAVIAGINIVHLVLLGANVLPDFTSIYLGGFRAVPFYLPIMLSGAVFAMEQRRTKVLLAVLLGLFFVGSAAAPPYKMELYPAFISLASLAGIGSYYVVRRLHLPRVEYIGRSPLRFWLMMLLMFFCPIKLYAFAHGKSDHLDFSWPSAFFCGAAALVVLYLLSRTIDAAKRWSAELEVRR